MEAGISGTPTIGYNAPGIRNAIQHNQTGILTPPQSPLKLAEAIVKLLNNPKKLTKLSNNARAYHSQFTIKKTVDVFEKILLAQTS